MDKDWQAEIALLRRREAAARSLLGVSDEASPAQVRRAYRKAVLACHPDRHPNDEGASRRMYLVCCAYKCLTEGQLCEEIDELEDRREGPQSGRYRLDNPWGYWCWWREKYFGKPT